MIHLQLPGFVVYAAVKLSHQGPQGGVEKLVLQHLAELEGSIRRDLVRLFRGEEMTYEETHVAISPTRYAFPRAPRAAH